VSSVGHVSGGALSWRDATADALYAPGGFYQHPGAPAARVET